MATLQECKCAGVLTGVCGNNYLVKCKNCRYRRDLGNAPITADVLASKHMVKTKHTVEIIPKHGEKLTVAPSRSKIEGSNDVPF